MNLNIIYLLIDDKGFPAGRFSVPPEMFPLDDIPEGHRIVVPADEVFPQGRVRLDLRKVRKPINAVASIESVQASFAPAEPSAAAKVTFARIDALALTDSTYAERLERLAGPMAALHAEKRRQAEAGGGPLVADENDRQAILANAAAQDQAVADLERERRAVKASIRAASDVETIEAIAQTLNGKK